MGKNRGEPLKVPSPEPESSDEDEGSSEESGSEESEEQTQTPAKPQQPPPPHPKEPSSEDEEEEESGSDTEAESDTPASKVKPLASKPVEEKQKASDGASKSKTITPKESRAAKRPAQDTSGKDSKKSKKADDPETSEKKSHLFQRLWSEEDEIVVLEGMIDYTSKKKADPVSDLNAFHDFIKQKLSIDVTRTQLQDKIRRLKKKYENNKSKVKDGEEKTFSKPHEHKSYHLSKQIWGKRNETIKENATPKGTSRVAGSMKADESEEAKHVHSVGASVEGSKFSVGASVEERVLIAGESWLEGKEEWEKVKEEEFQLYLKQLEVKVVQTKLVLDAMKGRGH